MRERDREFSDSHQDRDVCCLLEGGHAAMRESHQSFSSACCSGSTISDFLAIATDSIATLSWPLCMPASVGAMGGRLDDIKPYCKSHAFVWVGKWSAAL